jgi:hypothetical protein
MSGPRLSIDERRARCLRDTGVLCRELLGYDYDEDLGGQRINEGTGGIRDTGMPQQMIELLDDPYLNYKLIIGPRECRKSTKAQGFCIKHILLNPDVRIFYVGRTDAIMKDKCLAIRNQMEREEVVKLFGVQRGEKWGETEFTVRGRKNMGLQNSTLTGFSAESLRTGGRCDILVVDDFIDHNSVTTPEQIAKSKHQWALMMPLVARGGMIVVFGTVWDDDDLNVMLQSNPLFRPPLGGQIVCGAGVRVIIHPTGELDLEVTEDGLTFPHLTREYLLQKLKGMASEGKVDHFIRQYLNVTTSAVSTSFKRTQFQPVAWDDTMQKLSGFLLTDTAISQSKDACFSVCAYAGLDAFDNIYLLDLACGHWDPTEFADQFFVMLDRWSPRLNHIGEAWEDVSLATAYRHIIEHDSRVRRFRLNLIEMKRPPASNKEGRIMHLQPDFQGKRFWVSSTVPKMFMALDGPKLLWDPIGHYDPITRSLQPGGELVDQFIRGKGKRDIPDTIGMLREYEKGRRGMHRRLCQYRPWKPKQQTASLTDERRNETIRREYEHDALTGGDDDWWKRNS